MPIAVRRTPYLQVTGPNGEDMLKTWGSRLIGVKLIDRDSDVSDEGIFMFTRKPPYVAVPGENAPFTVKVGWSPTNVVITGVYLFQRTHIFGAPKRGQQIHFICRAADLAEYLKRVDSQHFDGENGHKTLGDVFQSLFRGSGKQVMVHPDIAKQALPGGYMMRWNQSAIDFAADLADSFTGSIKVMNDKVLIQKRGSGESVSGDKLPTVTLKFDENFEFDVELEPRFEFQKVSASYLDTDKGTLEREDKTSGQGQNGDALPHPFPSKDAAAAAAASVAQAWQANAGQGLFTSHGLPEAVSGAPVKCQGYGSPIDETEWLADTVTHDINPGVGWVTTVETKVGKY